MRDAVEALGETRRTLQTGGEAVDALRQPVGLRMVEQPEHQREGAVLALFEAAAPLGLVLLALTK